MSNRLHHPKDFSPHSNAFDDYGKHPDFDSGLVGGDGAGNGHGFSDGDGSGHGYGNGGGYMCGGSTVFNREDSYGDGNGSSTGAGIGGSDDYFNHGFDYNPLVCFCTQGEGYPAFVTTYGNSFQELMEVLYE